MDLSPPPRRQTDANLLPMINVVFLLLIFFLISSQLAPPEPFATTPPEAAPQDEAVGEFTLHLDAEGRIGFRDLIAEPEADTQPVLQALEAERADYCAEADCEAEPPRLFLRADAEAPVPALAGLLPRLGALGFATTDLVVGGEAAAASTPEGSPS